MVRLRGIIDNAESDLVVLFFRQYFHKKSKIKIMEKKKKRILNCVIIIPRLELHRRLLLSVLISQQLYSCNGDLTRNTVLKVESSSLVKQSIIMFDVQLYMYYVSFISR